jgi:hypothetical protein
MSLDDNLRKIPPQNLEAESSTLGGILLENESIKPVLEIVRPEDFYRHSHQKIFRAMIELSERREPVDLITLSDFLKGKNELEAVGGSAYLAALADFVPTAANVAYYARIVHNKAVLRSLITVATKVATRGYEEQDNIEELLSILKKGTSDIESRNGTQEKHRFTLLPVKDILAADDTETSWQWEGILPEGGMSLCVAKPKVGKTTLALNLAVAVARGTEFLGRKVTQGPVVYLALEEKKAEVKKKLLAAGIEDEPIKFHFGSAPQEAMKQVEPLIKDTGAKLLVIDVLQKFCRLKDLNDYAVVTNALEPLMAAARKQGCHILLTHHAGKADRPDGDDILGSTGLLGGVDTSIHIKKRDKRRCFFTIQRYGDDVEETVIDLKKDGSLEAMGSRQEVEIEEVKPLITAAVKTEWLAKTEIYERIEKGKTIVSKAVDLLVESGDINRIGTGKRNDPYKYSALLSSDTIEGNRAETKTASNPLESNGKSCPEDFNLFDFCPETQKEPFSTQKQAKKEAKNSVEKVMEIWPEAKLRQ